MVNRNQGSYRDLWRLGIVLTIPMVLLSGPLAGYLIGNYLLVGFFGLSETVVPVFIGLGILAGALQVFKLIKKIKNSEE